MMFTQVVRDQVSIHHCVTEFFQITYHHLFDPLLHLVANVISELEMHEDILSPWRGECGRDQVSLVVYWL